MGLTMRIRMAFSQAIGDAFLVTCEFLPESESRCHNTFVLTSFADENEFLEKVACSDLCNEAKVDLVSAALLMIAQRSNNRGWIELVVTWRQYLNLGLNVGSERDRSMSEPSEVDLHFVMQQTPVAFAVMTGPEHRISFINDPYAAMLRRTDRTKLLGKALRVALPELQGQPCCTQLDRVYRTGEPLVGRNKEVALCDESTGEIHHSYFDFVYHPLRDRDGEVCGVMAQATDVTEKILGEQVNEAREEQLYKQWAELDAIYRNSPLAMCLLDAKDYRILRLNDMQAELLGGRTDDLLGKCLPELVPDLATLRKLYARVARGEEVHNVEIRREVPPGAGVIRTWLVTCSPLFEETGVVGAIASIGMEITDKLELMTSGSARMPSGAQWS